MKNILLCFCLTLCLAACDPPIDSKLKIVNTSNQPVLIFYNTEGTNHSIRGLSLDYDPFHEIHRADTSRSYRDSVLVDSPDYLLPGDTVSANLGFGSWESHIGSGHLWVYVIEPETVLKNDWKNILEGKKWKEVHSLTLDQVKAKNWIVKL